MLFLDNFIEVPASENYLKYALEIFTYYSFKFAIKLFINRLLLLLKDEQEE